MDNYIKFNDNTILKIMNPNKKHIIFNSDFAKRYIGYLLIMEDLKSILRALDKLETEIPESIIRESLSFYIIIVYGKAFAKADVRKVKLEKGHLKDLRNDLIILHDVLIELRNKHVAHAGSEKFSLNNLVGQIEDNGFCETYLSGLSLASFTFNTILIRELVDEVLIICEKKAEKAYEIFELNLLDKEEVEKQTFLPSEFKIYSFEQIMDILVELTENFHNEI